jgi:hypothetical protein
MTLGYLVRWLAFQLGELDEPLEVPEARITVFSCPKRQRSVSA